MKKLLALILVFIMVFSLCSCQTFDNFKKAFIDKTKDQDEKIIYIGIFEPLTGRQSYDAEEELKGINLAHELYGEVLGYKIELISADNRSDTQVCKEAAQKLVNQGVSVIIGSVTDTLSLAGSDIFKENAIPAIAASCTIPILTLSNPYYFRVSCINSFDASGAAKYAYDGLNEEKVAILYMDEDDFSSNKAELFEEKFLSLVGSETFDYETSIINEETNLEETIVTKEPRVLHINISGNETDAEILSIFKELDMKGYRFIYCPLDEDLALPWIALSHNYEFIEEEQIRLEQEEQRRLEEEQKRLEEELKRQQEELEKEQEQEQEETTDEPTEEPIEEPTDEPIDDPSEEPTDEPTEEPVEEPLPEDNYAFTFVGTDLWSDIEEKAVLYLNSQQKSEYDSQLETEEIEEVSPLFYILSHTSFTRDYDAEASSNTLSDEFLSIYSEKYGVDAVPSENCALGFDAYYLAYTSIKTSIEKIQNELLSKMIAENTEEGKTFTTDDIDKEALEVLLFTEQGYFNKELIYTELHNIRNLQAVTGTISIDKNGDPVKDTLIEGYSYNKYQVIYTVLPDNMEE